MKNKKSIFSILSIVLGLGFACLFWITKPDPQVEDKSFKALPLAVKEVLLAGKKYDPAEYSKKVSNINSPSSYHRDTGEKLYTIALSSNFYSTDKLKLLSMAKIHLMKAKELGN